MRVKNFLAGRRLAVVVAILGTVLNGCSGGGSSPTELTAPPGPSATAVASLILQGFQGATNGKAGGKDQVYVPFDSRVACPGGGYGEVSGSISGNTQSLLSIGGQATYTNCGDQGYVLNGDPHISFAGTISAVSGNLQVQFGGGVRWIGGGGSGSCQISLTLLADSQSAHLSGTVCGQQVDIHS